MDRRPQTLSHVRKELNRINHQLDSFIDVTAWPAELMSQLRMIGDADGHRGRKDLELQEAAMAAVQRVKPSEQRLVAWLIALVLLAAILVVHLVWHRKK
jgi:hypothetical protein